MSIAPSRLIRPRSRRTPGARSRYRACPSSYGRMPMLEGAPTTAIARAMVRTLIRRSGRKMPRGAGVGSSTTLAPRTPTVSPAASGGASCTASKFTSADSYSSVVCSRLTSAWSKSRCACVTRNVVDSPTSKRRRSDSRRCCASIAPARAASHALSGALDLPAGAAYRSRRPAPADLRSSAPPAASLRRRARSSRLRNCDPADNSRSDRSSMSGSRW